MQGGGAVAVFSLKSPGHPEYFFVAESGARPLLLACDAAASWGTKRMSSRSFYANRVCMRASAFHKSSCCAFCLSAEQR